MIMLRGYTSAPRIFLVPLGWGLWNPAYKEPLSLAELCYPHLQPWFLVSWILKGRWAATVLLPTIYIQRAMYSVNQDTDIVPAPGKGEAERTLHLRLPETLSVLKG